MTSKLTGEGDEAADVLKNIAIFGNKQRLLSINMKTKVVQHVPWIIFNVFKVFEFSSFQVFLVFQNIPGSQLLSDIQTFFSLGHPTPPLMRTRGTATTPCMGA